ncbi:exodeoxyribonuclease VII large subunit [Bacillus gobiensis]|uniref:Exodeoxyribonuclease 7 large subunit n=1 Tax=Bacillus gobiensis TaxID=1441095 RepID=A0A0M4G8L9_9BACI|nr:exodeoxyribonuclease VII large subunit [Bacillus gobiensis]ALC81570.1 exodeoxyribonuclease VII large subunit [Bacillus gobiensis]
MSEPAYVTVTALTKYIKRKFDVDPHLENIWIKGELSNVKIHSRGHIYFTLKDENARIQSVMFARQNKDLSFTPESGMKVLVRGGISVYEPSGNYQLYAKEIQPDGIGALYLAYEELKNKLAKEGLFDESHKKPIPRFPATIGIITSPTGAAIRDILITIKRRYPLAKTILYPALVQGVNAGQSIAGHIQKANAAKLCDVLIVGRGGGSIEELWAFNEEIVAREIFSSEIPVISAVGHETDYTISDFVADLRAPTPTGAAELAVPHTTELMERIGMLRTTLLKDVQQKVKREKEILHSLQSSYAFKYPKRLFEQKEQQFDLMFDRLQKKAADLLDRKKMKLERESYRLSSHHPKHRLDQAEKAYLEKTATLKRAMSSVIRENSSQFQSVLGKLQVLSPLHIMQRGYSLVYKDEEIAKSVQNVQLHDRLKIKMNDGNLLCEVLGKEEEVKSGDE